MSYTLDFETRSEADIKKTGSYEYACHPSTDIICVSMQYLDDEPVLWHPDFEDQTPLVALSKAGRELPPEHLLAPPLPEEFFAAIERGDEIEAHNAFFERCVWHFVMVKKYGWPEIDPSQWRCSAAKAASFALPRPLQDACIALGLKEQKDMEGHRLMLKLCKPRKPIKRERELIAEASHVTLPEVPGNQTVIQLKGLGFEVPDSVFEWNQKREDLLRVFEYCKQDTRSERDLSNQLRPIAGKELEVWKMDQEMNWRGIQCDRAMATSAVKLAAESRNQAGVELGLITNGDVQKVTDRAGFLRWLNGRGVTTTSLAAPMVKDILESWEIDVESREALEIWKRSNKTSVKKYDAMLARMNVDDDRIRDLLMYWGASTGRWAGRGIQVQNFPRGFKGHEIEQVCEDIMGYDFPTFCLFHSEEEVLKVLANALRGALMAAPGKDLIAADFSAIEARGTFWLAGEKHSLEAFRAYDRGEGADIYCVQASKIYGIPIENVCMDKHRPNGKIAILGCFGPDTPVLTDRGWAPIVNVTNSDRVWDGVEWVSHDGVIDQGIKETIDLCGVAVTPDHEILIADQTWSPALEVGRPERTHSLRSAIKLADSLLPESKPDQEVGSSPFMLGATAEDLVGYANYPTYSGDKPRSVMSAPNSRPSIRISSNPDTKKSCLIPRIESGGSIDTRRSYPGATRTRLQRSGTTAAGGYTSLTSGSTGTRSFETSKATRGGTIPPSRSIGSTTMDRTLRGTSGWQPGQRTASTVFDVLNAGPRNRFTIMTEEGPLIVHNCGYQMGWKKLVSYAAQMGVIIDDETAKKIVSGYREDHFLTVKMWYGLQGAAIEAIRRRGRGAAVTWGRTKWKVVGRFLHCRLPSGRLLSYFDPEVNMVEIVINRDEPDEYRKTVPQISFMGMDTYTHQWTRCTTYGGKLTENVIQALCRDLMAEAMLRLRGTVYTALMTVHDEIVAEVMRGLGSLEEFIQIMSIVPKWAPGFPVAAGGWRGRRFRK